MSKTIGIAITGGISAYKIADLVSRLKKDDLDILVMMTESATKFITPLTFKTLSGREVYCDLWEDSREWKVQHIGIAEAIDLLVVAPATANMIAKMANGIADDLISTVVLANTAPVLVIPAMNHNMYSNPVVQDNIGKLVRYGYEVMEPATGMLACGAEGKGKLPDLEEIYQKIHGLLRPNQDLIGKRLMVNAGTTCEDIDPVRFIANRSTGKMGYVIAQEAVKRGADVILVSGKSNLNPPVGVQFLPAWGAEEMCAEMIKYQPACDIIIGAAAVGDFKVDRIAQQKIKKMDGQTAQLTLDLVSTPDILATLGLHKHNDQIMVGFAAETENVLENAARKLIRKNLDFIVANDLTLDGAGFGTDTNVVTFINRDGTMEPLPMMSKKDVANAILDKIVQLERARR